MSSQTSAHIRSRRTDLSGGVAGDSPETYLTPLGAATVVLDIGGIRLLVDPVFGRPAAHAGGGAAPMAHARLAAWDPEELGPLTCVLVTDDRDPGRLDATGRQVLRDAPIALTARAAACRLGEPAIGLDPWAVAYVPRPDGNLLEITAIPARDGHGNGDARDDQPTGFLLAGHGLPTVYIVGGRPAVHVATELVARWPLPDAIVVAVGDPLRARAGDRGLAHDAAAAAELALILGGPTTLVEGAHPPTDSSDDPTGIDAAFAAVGLGDAHVPARPGLALTL